jgi:hypothetical protein
MKRLMDLGRRKPWFGLGLVAALAVAGALALSQERAAEADLISLSLDTSVVTSGAVVTATLTAEDDDAIGPAASDTVAGSNPYLFAPIANVSNANQGEDTANLPDGISEVSCFVAGVDCTSAPEPQTCTDADPDGAGGNDPEPNPALVACISYSDGTLDDPTASPDSTQETLVAELAITVTCTTPTLVPISAGDQDPGSTDTTVNVLCLPTGTVADITVDKVFDGAQDVAFTFQYAGPDGGECIALIEPDGILVDLSTETQFELTGAQTAELYGCGIGTHTITEADPAPDAAFVSAVCTPEQQPAGAGNGVAVSLTEITTGVIACVFTNTADTSGDDPGLPNIEVTKVCVGEGFDATFDISIGELTETVECDGVTTALDLDPATYSVSEAISGDDADAFATVIVCSDAGVVAGTETTVTIPEEGATDVFCVIINTFDPDGALDGDADGDGIPDALEDLLCGCLSLDLEIDIDNTNNNTIGIDNDNTNNNANDNDNFNENLNDNENKNDNKNENTQNQENTQDQNNTNDQSNNITSSPEVNIDFDE